MTDCAICGWPIDRFTGICSVNLHNRQMWSHLVPSRTVIDLARAIAFAEGFGIKNAVPTLAHNPGDLKIPGWMGPKLGAEGITVFPDDETGWDALYSQLERIQDGRSHVYSSNMTLGEFGEKWTDTQQSSWIMNVVYKIREMGYDISGQTTLGDFFAYEL